MKPIVYIDMLFLLNFLINSVTLCTSSLFIRKPPSVLKLMLASGFSALYSTFMFFPQVSFLYSLVLKTLFLALTVWIAFPTKKPLQIFRNAIIFWGTNLLYGGAAFFLIFCTNFGTSLSAAVSNGEIYLDISFEVLLFSAILSYIKLYIFSYIKAQAKQLVGVHNCPYASSLQCESPDSQCKSCGWNPVVDSKRRRMLDRGQLSKNIFGLLRLKLKP